MPQDPVAVVHAVYAALNTADAGVFDLLDAQIEWVTPASLPWTVAGSDGCYRGHGALAEYFTRCLAHVEDLRVEVTDLLPLGDQVVALGYECGRSRATGKAFRARFAQLWSVHNDQVARLEGFPDTAAMAAAFPSSADA